MKFYGKIQKKERLGIFASNFLAVQDFHEKTGRPLVLNEFADLTEEEYRQDNNQSSTSDGNDKPVTSERFPAEDRIREAYIQWCDYYERSYDERRLQTFVANFVAVEKYHLQTKTSLVLNEYADMTEPEYRKHLATAAHFTTPENIGPRANDDSNTFLQEQGELNGSNNDPITSYLDPNPSPISYSQVEELKPPIHRAQTPIVQNENVDGAPIILNDSSVTHEALATLQNTVASLSAMVESLAAAPPVAPKPTAQPLDSLVIDLLQQQDGSISQLEESIEGLHEIQKQSSDLIELVSNNQRQMTEMMEVVQFEVAALQIDQEQVEENYALLLNRIEELEKVVAKFDDLDPVLQKSLVPSTPTATQRRRVELKPNIQPVGYTQPCISP
jgi:hypothetical protein